MRKKERRNECVCAPRVTNTWRSIHPSFHLRGLRSPVVESETSASQPDPFPHLCVLWPLWTGDDLIASFTSYQEVGGLSPFPPRPPSLPSWKSSRFFLPLREKGRDSELWVLLLPPPAFQCCQVWRNCANLAHFLAPWSRFFFAPRAYSQNMWKSGAFLCLAHMY